MNYQLITSNEALETVCQQARTSAYVALDTEFVRTRTYYPGLGLIQLYDGQQLVLIDPFTIDNWQPFIQLLADTTVTKLLHACSEDLEIFQNYFNQIPVPMIDTQILAAFIDYPLSSGFATLVADKLAITLDKSESRTDWLARPLSAEQLDYASADVLYLLPLAQKLFIEVKAVGWWDAAMEECQRFSQRRAENITAEEVYFHIANAWQLDRNQLGTLSLLAAWRMKYAQEKDIALNFVVKEANLLQVAKFQPISMAKLEKLGLYGAEIRYHGRTLISLVEESQKIPEQALPELISRLCEQPRYKAAFKALKTIVQQVAKERELSLELLGSRKQINHLLRWHWQGGEELPPLISGWRDKLFAQQLKDVLVQYPSATD